MMVDLGEPGKERVRKRSHKLKEDGLGGLFEHILLREVDYDNEI